MGQKRSLSETDIQFQGCSPMDAYLGISSNSPGQTWMGLGCIGRGNVLLPWKQKIHSTHFPHTLDCLFSDKQTNAKAELRIIS